jgi:hypothetical protein
MSKDFAALLAAEELCLFDSRHFLLVIWFVTICIITFPSFPEIQTNFFIAKTNLPAPESFYRQRTCIKTTYDDLCSVPKMAIKG